MKKSFLGITILIILLSVGFVCAADFDSNMTLAADDGQIAVDESAAVGADNSQVSSDDAASTDDDNQALAGEADDVLSASGNDDNVGTGETKGFADVRTKINSASQGGVVELDGYYNGDGNPIKIGKELTIQGKNNATLDGCKKSTILAVTGYTKLTLKNLIFKNAKGNAVLAYLSSTSKYNKKVNLVVDNCTFMDNVGTSDGGAINAYYCRITNSKFINNNVGSKNGGAIYAYRSAVINNCQFINNSARNGGVIYSEGAVTVDNS